jgi:hypothetical protein
LLRYFGANCATLRPERSESPPAANGITNVIGLDGYPLRVRRAARREQRQCGE